MGVSISKKIGPWKFAKINTIEERIFNPLLEDFVKYGLSGLVRENIQNALDAKLPDNSEPVQVKICAGEISVQEIERIADIRERIECLEGRECICTWNCKIYEEMHTSRNSTLYIF